MGKEDKLKKDSFYLDYLNRDEDGNVIAYMRKFNHQDGFLLFLKYMTQLKGLKYDANFLLSTLWNEVDTQFVEKEYEFLVRLISEWNERLLQIPKEKLKYQLGFMVSIYNLSQLECLLKICLEGQTISIVKESWFYQNIANLKDGISKIEEFQKKESELINEILVNYSSDVLNHYDFSKNNELLDGIHQEFTPAEIEKLIDYTSVKKLEENIQLLLSFFNEFEKVLKNLLLEETDHFVLSESQIEHISKLFLLLQERQSVPRSWVNLSQYNKDKILYYIDENKKLQTQLNHYATYFSKDYLSIGFIDILESKNLDYYYENKEFIAKDFASLTSHMNEINEALIELWGPNSNYSIQDVLDRLDVLSLAQDVLYYEEKLLDKDEFERIKSKVATLKHQVADINLIKEQILTEFNEAIFSYFTKDLNERFNYEYTSIFRVLKKQYREDMKQLNEIYKKDSKLSFSEAQSIISQLNDYYQRLEQLEDEFEQEKALLGVLNQGLETDFQQIDKNFELIEQLIKVSQDKGISTKEMKTLMNQPIPHSKLSHYRDIYRDSIQAINEFMVMHKPLLKEVFHDFEFKCINQMNKEAHAIIQEGLKSISSIQSVLDNINGDIPDVNLFRSLITTHNTLVKDLNNLKNNEEELQNIFEDDYQGLDTSWDRIKKKLDWFEEIWICVGNISNLNLDQSTEMMKHLFLSEAPLILSEIDTFLKKFTTLKPTYEALIENINIQSPLTLKVVQEKLSLKKDLLQSHLQIGSYLSLYRSSRVSSFSCLEEELRLLEEFYLFKREFSKVENSLRYKLEQSYGGPLPDWNQIKERLDYYTTSQALLAKNDIALTEDLWKRLTTRQPYPFNEELKKSINQLQELDLIADSYAYYFKDNRINLKLDSLYKVTEYFRQLNDESTKVFKLKQYLFLKSQFEKNNLEALFKHFILTVEQPTIMEYSQQPLCSIEAAKVRQEASVEREGNTQEPRVLEVMGAEEKEFETEIVAVEEEHSVTNEETIEAEQVEETPIFIDLADEEAFESEESLNHSSLEVKGETDEETEIVTLEEHSVTKEETIEAEQVEETPIFIDLADEEAFESEGSLNHSSLEVKGETDEETEIVAVEEEHSVTNEETIEIEQVEETPIFIDLADEEAFESEESLNHSSLEAIDETRVVTEDESPLLKEEPIATEQVEDIPIFIDLADEEAFESEESLNHSSLEVKGEADEETEVVIEEEKDTEVIKEKNEGQDGLNSSPLQTVEILSETNIISSQVNASNLGSVKGKRINNKGLNKIYSKWNQQYNLQMDQQMLEAKDLKYSMKTVKFSDIYCDIKSKLEDLQDQFWDRIPLGLIYVDDTHYKYLKYYTQDIVLTYHHNLNYPTALLITVCLVKIIEREFDGNDFWGSVFKALVLHDTPERRKLMQEATQALCAKHNLYFHFTTYEKTIRRNYRSTIMMHAIVSNKSSQSFFDFIYDFYIEDLNEMYQDEVVDEKLTELIKLMDEDLDWFKEDRSGSEVDANSIYQLSVFTKMAIVYYESILGEVLKNIIYNMNAFQFKTKDYKSDPIRFYELYRQWRSQLVVRNLIQGTKNQSAKMTSLLKTRRKRNYRQLSKATYVLRDRELVLCIPEQTIDKKYVNCHLYLEFYEKDECIKELTRELEPYGKVNFKTEEIELSVNKVYKQLSYKIFADNQLIFESSDVLNRHYITFDEQFKEKVYNTQPTHPFYLVVNKDDFVTIDGFYNEYDEKDYKIYSLQLEKDDQVVLNNQVLFNQTLPEGIKRCALDKTALRQDIKIETVSNEYQVYTKYPTLNCSLYDTELSNYYFEVNGCTHEVTALPHLLLNPNDERLKKYEFELSGDVFKFGELYSINLCKKSDNQLIFSKRFIILDKLNYKLDKEFYYQQKTLEIVNLEVEDLTLVEPSFPIIKDIRYTDEIKVDCRTKDNLNVKLVIDVPKILWRLNEEFNSEQGNQYLLEEELYQLKELTLSVPYDDYHLVAIGKNGVKFMNPIRKGCYKLDSLKNLEEDYMTIGLLITETSVQIPLFEVWYHPTLKNITVEYVSGKVPQIQIDYDYVGEFVGAIKVYNAGKTLLNEVSIDSTVENSLLIDIDAQEKRCLIEVVQLIEDEFGFSSEEFIIFETNLFMGDDLLSKVQNEVLAVMLCDVDGVQKEVQNFYLTDFQVLQDGIDYEATGFYNKERAGGLVPQKLGDNINPIKIHVLGRHHNQLQFTLTDNAGDGFVYHKPSQKLAYLNTKDHDLYDYPDFYLLNLDK